MAITSAIVCTAIIIVCICISLITESLHLSKFGHEEEVLQLSFQPPGPDSPPTTSSLDVVTVPSKSDDSLNGEETPHLPASSVKRPADTRKFTNSVPASRPPSCTAEQLAAIYLRLPEFRNKECQARGWFNKCPISLVTGCPETTWLDEHYQYNVPDTMEDFLAINVGCNKGYDAVNFLRIGSNDPSIARKTWREALPPDTAPGVCGQQQDSTQYQILSSPYRRINRNAIVYCIEPMPSTFLALQNAANATGWAAQLKVLQLAIDNQEPATVAFPEPSPENLGFEKQAIGKCKERLHSCVPVETQRLDLMMSNQQLSGKRVHIMLVDVEGFDFEVLKGGNTTLQNTEYVEFEFNWRGQWGSDFRQGRRPLKSAIDYMNNIGFTCYWPGQGELWRITGCWQPHYDGSFWSNIACANRQLAPALHERMETLFLKTIDDSLVADPVINATHFQKFLEDRYDQILLTNKGGEVRYKLIIVEGHRRAVHPICVWEDPPRHKSMFAPKHLQGIARRKNCVRMIALKRKPAGISPDALERELSNCVAAITQNGLYLQHYTLKRQASDRISVNFIYIPKQSDKEKSADEQEIILTNRTSTLDAF